MHITVRLPFLIVLFFVVSITSSIAVSLTTINWDDNKSNFFQFNIGVNATVNYRIDNQVDNAGYFVVDLKDVSPYGTQDIPVNHQLVPLVRPAYDFDNRVLRFVFYVQRPIEFSVTLTTNSPPTLVIRIFRQIEPTPTPFLQKRKKVVVIDPGHGGTSYGAQSPRKVNGSYAWEKDIVLQIGKMLQRHIDNSPNMIARMTRTGDTTLSLSSRIRISEQVKGDVFISLHCNAVYGKRATNAHGIEFYFLNEKGSRDEITKQLEELENEDTINEESFTQYRRLFQRLTEDNLAVLRGESKMLCHKLSDAFHTHSYYKRNNRGVKEARFKVLKNHVMPAALIETGFIANLTECKKLIDPTFQNNIAVAIFNGLNLFFAEVDPAFQPYQYKYY